MGKDSMAQRLRALAADLEDVLLQIRAGKGDPLATVEDVVTELLSIADDDEEEE